MHDMTFVHNHDLYRVTQRGIKSYPLLSLDVSDQVFLVSAFMLLCGDFTVQPIEPHPARVQEVYK